MRPEYLSGPLTMDQTNGANLTIQTGVNSFDLNGKVLSLSCVEPTANPNGITIISGSILADPMSKVDFACLGVIPANMFTYSEAGTIIIGRTAPTVLTHPERIELRGDLRINTKLEIQGHGDKLYFITGKNVLTISDGATAEFDVDHYVVGNLVRTVNNLDLKEFYVGSIGDDSYTPV